MTHFMSGIRFLSVAVGCIVAVIGILAPCTSAAERGLTHESSNGKLTLRQALSIALARNLTLTQGRLEVQRNEHIRREAYSDFFPSVNVQYSASGYRYRQPGNVYDLTEAHDSRWWIRSEGGLNEMLPDYPYRTDPYKSFTLAATLTQPLFTGGQLLNNYKYAKLGVDQANIDLRVARQNLVLQVYEAYFQLVLANKLLEVANQSIAGLQALKHQSEELFKVHLILKVDVLAIETQLAQEQLTRVSAEADIERYRASLNNLLRYPQGTRTKVVNDVSYRPTRYEIPEIYSIAASNRLEIRQADITVEQAVALAKASQGNLVPQVDLQVTGSRTNDDWNPFDPEAVNDWSVQGVLSWTFDMFRSRETVKENRVVVAQSFVTREQVVEEIMKEVQQAYIDVKRSEKNIRINRRAVEFSAQTFKANKELYDRQLASYLEVLSAEEQMADAKRAYYASLIAHKINSAILERKMGVIR